MPRRIIIDTDPGIDDAVAILLALAAPEELEVLGIVAVAGNLPVGADRAQCAPGVRTGGTPGHPRLCRLRAATTAPVGDGVRHSR